MFIADEDPSKQSLVVTLHIGETESVLIATNFCPLNINVYKVGIANTQNPFHKVIQTIHDVSALGETWIIVGDFNAKERL